MINIPQYSTLHFLVHRVLYRLANIKNYLCTIYPKPELTGIHICQASPYGQKWSSQNYKDLKFNLIFKNYKICKEYELIHFTNTS